MLNMRMLLLGSIPQLELFLQNRLSSSYLRIKPLSDPILETVWKFKLPLCIQFHMWLAIQSKLLTNEERNRRHLIDYVSCAACVANAESTIHALRDYPYSIKVWENSRVLSVLPNFFNAHTHEWWKMNIKNTQVEIWNCPWSMIFCVTCWWL